MKKTPIYLMPGMAASPRIFEFIQLPGEYEVIHLSWIPPKNNERISDYALRMCQRVTHINPVLLGVSFGGILVQEMAKHIACKKVIVVSSVKSNQELPLSMKVAKSTGAHKLLPTQWINSLESLVLFVFGPSIRSKIEAYQTYLSERDPEYLKWAINSLVHWSQDEISPNVIHIHGDNDAVFPIKNIKQKTKIQIIKKGTHAMILTHNKWFNSHIPSLISNQV